MTIREAEIDFDARPRPKTAFWCCKCQRDLNPSSAVRWVHVGEWPFAIHPDSEAEYSQNPVKDEYGWLPVGVDCARAIGLEFTHAEKPAA